MTDQTARGWLRWYPRSWRDRYGDELAALLEDLEEDRDMGLPGST